MGNFFSHSGDIGDIIYGLPVIRAKGGGTLALFNYPGRTYQPMTQARVDKLYDLFMYQDYIRDFYFSKDKVDTSLNGFRDHLRNGRNTSDAHLSTHGLSWEHRVKAWLKVPSPLFTTEVVVAWTPRHHSFDFPWSHVVNTYKNRITYLGFEDDFQEFTRKYGKGCNFYDAKDFMTIARVVEGCRLFIGNLTSITAIAEALKKNMISEGWNKVPANHFLRPNALVLYHEDLELPELCELA